MIHLIKEYKLYIMVGLAICAAVFYFIFLPNEDQHDAFKENEWLLASEENKVEDTETATINNTVIVDVKGAVKASGVYEADGDDRVFDLINKAGGLQENADEAQINFAMRVEDEMVIYVPKIGEVEEGVSPGKTAGGFIGAGQAKNDGKVNLNTANETELQTLPGIGPAKASAIIEYREANGPFKVIEDLKSISGIGDKTFEKLKDSIKVN